MAAWHEDDPGRRLSRMGWDHVHLPAIDDHGQALWPERFPIPRLRAIQDQLGDYGFESLYQGRPRPRGGAVFRDVHTYDTLPEGLHLAIGVDFAYSTRTHSDYSVAIVLGTDGEQFFVIDVVRMQVTAPVFQAELDRLQRQYPSADLVAYVSGTERGVVDMMIAQGLNRLQPKPVVGDKFTRSQPVAAAWNGGNVLVPAKDTGWRDPFISEVCGFTGIRDRRDDQVDALAAAFDAIKDSGRRGRGIALGRSPYRFAPDHWGHGGGRGF
jgi:predicted phage terminase large subunit-like protein